MEELIEELTKVNPSNLSEEGLKLFNKINEIIDRNEELEECLEVTSKALDNVAYDQIPIAIQELEEKTEVAEWKLEHSYNTSSKACEIISIPKSLIKEKIEPVINNLERDGFVGYADELRDIISELMEEK